jgi:hypothetical protein
MLTVGGTVRSVDDWLNGHRLKIGQVDTTHEREREHPLS